MHVQFDCGVKNGGFAIDCKGGFVMCSNGEASLMRCPHSLTFDEETQACQYPVHVASCGLSPVVSSDTVYTPPSATTTTTTTAAPQIAVEIPVNTPINKDVCIGSSSDLRGSTRDCASSFVLCEEGKVKTAISCAPGTFFDEKMKRCDYREIACAGGWTGEGEGSRLDEEMGDSSRVDESEYSRGPSRISRPYRPSMPIGVEKIEKKEEERREMERDPIVVPSKVEPAKEATCDWKGAASSGSCSSQFIICSNGRPEVFDCASQLVFDISTSACSYPQFVTGCPQIEEVLEKSAPLSSSPSTVSDDVIDYTSSEYSRDETPSTTTVRPLLPVKDGEHTNYKFEATGDHCTFHASQPSFPLNFCSMTYGVCTPDGMTYRTNCTFGFLFDSVIRHCVPAEHCGQSYLKDIAGSIPSPSISSIHNSADWNGDNRCVGINDGKLLAATHCSPEYIKCEKESVTIERCPGPAEVFSSLTDRCVLRAQMAECSSTKGSPAITRPKIVLDEYTVMCVLQPPSSSYPAPLSPPSHRGSRIRGGLSIPTHLSKFDARTFCTTKESDGLYRNPENCAGIVQCFGGEAFSYPSCDPGLFFNEIDGQCDYASNVPECDAQANSISFDGSSVSCKGQPHGGHLADDSDCSIYYRCVWGTLERLSCPPGTVFNPRLSVCDYAHQVPHCQKQ
ncbi:hypothetical protein PFISCL1PPCAC_15040 [Pristionchus fissidentatus]|uniref:Chitin-binding type-2 domain-containing protein n=1 Tax=Pristionchus fissidentatus TaxID=1538716 RepID=A0AAV5VZU3_9BILA|nr:hypothetical protein PFISCL1PPCAC_15040 [Pristionchus fissidentatus]